MTPSSAFTRPPTPSAYRHVVRRTRACAAVSWLALVLGWSGGAVAATASQALEAIEHRAETALREHTAGRPVSIETVSVDRRLRLPACSGALEASVAGVGLLLGRVSVDVACASGAAWRVRVAAMVSEQADVWTLARAVRRGDTLSRDDLSVATLALGSRDPRALRAGANAGDAVRADAADPEASLAGLLGQVFERNLPAGRLLTRTALSAPLLVERGRSVRMHYRGNGVSIEAVGTALADGRAGERIGVKNDVTGIAVDATVTDRDLVMIR